MNVGIKNFLMKQQFDKDRQFKIVLFAKIIGENRIFYFDNLLSILKREKETLKKKIFEDFLYT